MTNLYKITISVLIALFLGFIVFPVQGKGKYVPFKIKSMYHKDWIDLNKNGKMDPYENPALDIELRITDLLNRMTLEEKTCQLATLYGYPRVLKDTLPTPEWKNEVWKDGIGNIDEHCNGNKSDQCSWPVSYHVKTINEVQRWFVEDTRLGIPVDFTNEGIYGACVTGATLFPAQCGVGASWDKDLVSQIGNITAIQTKADGYTNVYSPILDVARDPRWGRIVESYGEDPYLVSQLGLQEVKAIQKNRVVSTVKHFAAYSIPIGGRDGMTRTDPQISFREMHTLLLPPFRTAFEVGHALGTMSSYNDYDGVPVTGSPYFLTELLRKDYGFKGYVVSDSNALIYIWSKHRVAPDYKDAVRQAVQAGMNVRTTFNDPSVFIKPLRELVGEGSLSMETLDARVSDVLRVKYWTGIFDRPYINDPEASQKTFLNPDFEKVSKRASYEAMTLLKNENHFLPLQREKIKNILIAGPNAMDTTLSVSRYGPKQISYKSVVSAFRDKLGSDINVMYAKGCDIVDKSWPESEIIPSEPSTDEWKEINDAVEKAKKADVAILVMGENNDIVGESKSRTSLDLTGYQQLLIDKIQETGTPVVLVLMNGRPLTINKADKTCQAIIEAWFPGKYGSEAIADIVFGDYNPGGKLNFTFPKSVGQIPMCFPYKPNTHSSAKTTVNGVLYPFGYGLSFTSFAFSNLKINPMKQKAEGNIEVSVDVKNTGEMEGDEVVQLYIKDEVSSVVRFVKELRGFERIHLQAGETKTVHFTLTPKDLQMLDRNMKWGVEPGWFKIMIGSSSEDIRQEGRFEITSQKAFNKSYTNDK
ncbi:glycoside hydrolase family 3 N-terminal domain-containing protein [Maribellus mangrovi]|uniref:glycoside hydrolase family 3 N-terminal domain-containing protein n=1 Tax=Maribellus mangrovi TaxID=3133146 RepID=UPI0030ED852C